MGNSQIRGCYHLIPELQPNPPRSPGSLGIRDAADPGSSSILGGTPGSLGRNDCGDPDNWRSRLGIHFTIFPDKDGFLWDYDPDRLLENPSLNPAFVEEAHRSLKRAINLGLRPKVHEAYRSPEESDRKYQQWKKKKGGRAAPAWKSCHNYGLAMDVYLYDSKAKYIDNKVKGWYRQYKLFASLTAGCVWGENFGDGDADHFEFHPNWVGGANGALLLKVREWAIQAAMAVPGASQLPNGQIGPVPEPSEADWIPFFWWAAGAGGKSPSGDFLAEHEPPT